jgi:hypothetical protein
MILSETVTAAAVPVIWASVATTLAQAIWRHGRGRGLAEARRAAELDATAAEVLRRLEGSE